MSRGIKEEKPTSKFKKELIPLNPFYIICPNIHFQGHMLYMFPTEKGKDQKYVSGWKMHHPIKSLSSTPPLFLSCSTMHREEYYVWEGPLSRQKAKFSFFLGSQNLTFFSGVFIKHFTNWLCTCTSLFPYMDTMHSYFIAKLHDLKY